MIWRFGEFTLDSVRYKLLARNGSIIPIQPKAFRVLECLVRNAPEVVPREQLLTEVWGHSELCVSALSQAIREIRRALNDDASLPSIIGTRHGAGYFLLVEAQPVPDGRRWWKSARWTVAPLPLRSIFIASAFLLAGLYGGTLWQRQNANETVVDSEQFDRYGGLGRDLAGDSEARALYRAGVSSLERLDWMPGIESLERARRTDPDSPRILLELTRGYHQAGYQERAAELAQDIRMGQQSWSRPEQLEAQAILALVEGNSATLATTARSLSDFFRDDIGFLYLLFQAELDSGPPAKAEATLDRIRSLLPDSAADARYWISMHHLKTRQGRIDEAIASADLALESSQGQELDRLHVRAMLAKIDSLTRLGDIDAARQLISQARPLADRLRDPAAHVQVIADAARLDILMGRFDGLEARVDEAFALSRQIGFRTGMARCNFLLGELYRAQGEHIPAIVHYGNSVSSYSRNGQLFDAALGLLQRSKAELGAGRLDSAEHGILEAEELFRRLNDRHGHGLVQIAMGELAARSHEFGKARELLEAGLLLSSDVSDVFGEADAAVSLARVLGATGDHERALELYERTRSTYQAVGNQRMVARTLLDLGRAHHRLGRLDQGRSALAASARMHEVSGRPEDGVPALLSLAQLDMSNANLHAAQGILETVEGFEISDPLAMAMLNTLKGRIAMLEMDLERSEDYFRKAQEARRDAGAWAWVLASELDFARLAIERGDAVQGESMARMVIAELDEFGTEYDRVSAALVLVDSLLSQGKFADAAREIEAVSENGLEQNDVELWLEYQMFATALGGPANAVSRLAQLRERATSLGYNLQAMKIDVSTAFVLAQTESQSEGGKFAASIAASAREAGIHCLAERIDRIPGLMMN